MAIYSVKSVEVVLREKNLPDDGQGPRWLVLGNEGVTVATTWTRVEAVAICRAKERESQEAALAYKKSVAASRTTPFDTPVNAIVALCEYAHWVHTGDQHKRAITILKTALDYSVVAHRSELQEALEKLCAKWAEE